MHTVFALLCFVVVIHWLIFPYPSGLLHWHCGNLTIAPVPAKQPWWIWINTSCEFIMNDCITTTKQSTTKPCAYFLGYTVDQTCWATAEWRYCLCQNVQSPHGARQFLGFFVGYKVSICASIKIKTTYTHIHTRIDMIIYIYKILVDVYILIFYKRNFSSRSLPLLLKYKTIFGHLLKRQYP